jgi:hypothetical protein
VPDARSMPDGELETVASCVDPRSGHRISSYGCQTSASLGWARAVKQRARMDTAPHRPIVTLKMGFRSACERQVAEPHSAHRAVNKGRIFSTQQTSALAR